MLPLKKLQHCTNLSLTSFFHTSCVLWFMIDFTRPFSRTSHGSRETCRYPQLWCLTVCPQWSSGYEPKIRGSPPSIPSSSKDQSRVSVRPRSPLSGEAQRQGRKAGDQLGVEELWEVWEMQAETAAWSCHLILKFSKVQRLQGHIYFLSLSFILLQPPRSNNLPQVTASFACAESWPGLHHPALGCFHSPLLQLLKPWQQLAVE